jgi:hypothetical protein
MKRISLFFAALVFFAFHPASFAAVVAGDPQVGCGTGTTVSFSAVNRCGFTMRLDGVLPVYETRPFPCAVKKADNFLGSVWVAGNPNALNGYYLTISGTQALWRGCGRTLRKFNFRSAELLGTGKMRGSSVDVNVRNVLPDVDRYLLIMVPELFCPNGAVAWASYPGYPHGEYMVYNCHGQPQMAVWVNNYTGRIEPPGEEGRQLARERE